MVSSPSSQELQAQVDELRRELDECRAQLRMHEAVLSSAGIVFWMVEPPYAAPKYLSESYPTIVGLEHSDASFERFVSLVHPADKPWVRDTMYRGLRSGQNTEVGPYRFIHPTNGERIFRTMVVHAGHLGSGTLCGFTEDVTATVTTERALEKIKTQHEAYLSNTSDVLFVWDRVSGTLEYASAAVEQLLGIPRAKLPLDVHALADAFIHPEDRSQVEASMLFNGNDQAELIEHRIVRPDGEQRWLWTRLQAISEDRIVGLASDVTERKRSERVLRELNASLEARVKARTAELEVALESQNLLLEEVHHRVKNNLQLVASLLYIHGQGIDAPALNQAFGDMTRRIRAMATVHEQLMSVQTGVVRLDTYLSALVRSLDDSLPDHRLVYVSDPALQQLSCSLENAVPVALLVNELVTNAARHGPTTGAIRIRLRPSGGMVDLCVTDEGNGFEYGDGESNVGLRLVEALARQLKATVTTSSCREGFEIRVGPLGVT